MFIKTSSKTMVFGSSSRPTSSGSKSSKQSKSGKSVANSLLAGTPSSTDERNPKENREIQEVSFVSTANPTKLYSFTKKENWVGVANRCKTHVAEVSTWIVDKTNNGETKWKSLPIHEACEKNAPPEVIKALIKAFPESLLLRNSDGSLPLHIACKQKSSKATIAALLSSEPSAAKVKDDDGKYPLHLACQSQVAHQIVESLIVCHYRGPFSVDRFDMLPLHWACRQNASFTIIERLLRANPEAVEKKDQWGRTPITLVEDNNHPEKDLVLKALHRDPSFWAGNFVDDIEKLKADVEKVPDGKVGKYELENAMLKEKIHDMVTMNNYNDEDIEKIHQENKDLVNQVRQLKGQLNNFVEIMRGIDEQRKALIEVADKMEESLKMASDIARGP